jgi:plasmid replication initiation protein
MANGTPVKPASNKALLKQTDIIGESSSGERWVTVTNALTRAGQSLTLAEKRLVMMAVSTLDSRKRLRPFEAPITRILATEYAEQFGVDTDTAYDQLRAAGKQLFNRYITFYEPAHRRRGKPLASTQVQMHWVGRATYHKGEGWIELAWWHELLPHLTGIQQQFTKYQLKQASALRSVYSWRLLELLTRFRSTGVAEYSIEDFATAMDATEKQRENFAKIRTRIIEPAVKELCDKDGWTITWTPVRAGRKVTGVRFLFERNPQGDLF